MPTIKRARVGKKTLFTKKEYKDLSPRCDVKKIIAKNRRLRAQVKRGK